MFLQPESQLRVIQALNSFDLSHAICALPALLLDEESGNDGRPEPTTVVDGAGASRTKATSAEPSGTQTSSVGHYDFTADGWTETIREDDGDGDYDAERKDWSSHWTPMGEHTQLPSDGEESESDPEGAALQDRDFPPASDDDEASRASGRVTRSSCRAFSAGDMEILPHNHSTKAPSAAARRLDTGTQWTQDMTQASQLFSQLLSSETAASVASDGTSPVRTRRQRSASQQSNSSATNSPSGKNGGASQRSMTASANKRPGSSQGSSKTALPAIPEDMSPGGQTADSLSLVSTQSSSQTPVVLQDHRLLSLYQKLSKEQWAVGGQLASPSKIANPTEVAATSTVGRTLSSSSSSSTVSHANAASAPPSQSASAVAMSCPAPALPPTRPAARQIADSAAWGGASTWTGEELSQQSLSLSLSQSQSQFLSLSHNSLQASGELKTSSSSSGGAPGSKGGNWLTRQQPYITQDELGSLLEWGTEDASQFIFPLDDSAAEDPEHSAVAAPATATAGAEASNTAPSSSNSSSFVCVDIVHTANASAESTDGGSDSGGGAPISGITQDESPQPQQQIILTTQVNSTAPPTDTPQRPTKPPAQYSQSQLLSTSAASQQSDSYREPSAPTPIVMINDGVSGRNAAMKRGRPVQLSTLRTASGTICGICGDHRTSLSIAFLC